MLATVEPVDPTPAGEAVARQALAGLRRSFVFAEYESLGDALTRAFETANRDVYEGNSWALGNDRRRLLVGATAVATDGEELLIALASPGQAVVVQEGKLFAFPDLASWQPNFEPECDQPGGDPLGVSDSVVPAIYRTTIAPGDAVLIGSTAVGRGLAASPRLAEIAGNPSWLPAEVKRLAGVDRHVGCVAWLTICAGAWPTTTAEPPSVEFPAGEWLSPGLRRAIFFDRLRTKLIELFERHAPAAKPPVLPLARSRRSAGPPGAGYVRRYRGAWRGDDSPFSLSHRSPGIRMPVRGRAIVAFLVLALTLCGGYAGYDYRQARASLAGSYLSIADANLAAVTSDLPAVTVETHLNAAETALENAARDGASDATLRPRREAIGAIRDRISGVTRLTDVVRLGTLPEAVDRTSPRLLSAGEQLYLIADAIYRVDAATRTLVRLLEPGRRVAGRPIGAHLTGATDGDVLTVSDGRTLFRLRTDDGWDAFVLGSRDGVEPTMSSVFIGHFYLLDPEAGEILKYPAKQLGAPPEVWLQDGRGTGPEGALDMVVDRNIYVLTAEGEIATYFRGVADGSFRPEVQPPVASAVALAGGPEMEALYLAETNGTAGRILRFDHSGRNVRQMLLPHAWQLNGAVDASDDLAQVSDIAVDEQTGTIYFVGRHGIWRASIPPEETTR